VQTRCHNINITSVLKGSPHSSSSDSFKHTWFCEFICVDIRIFNTDFSEENAEKFVSEKTRSNLTLPGFFSSEQQFPERRERVSVSMVHSFFGIIDIIRV
jgi:hypothetical protein